MTTGPGGRYAWRNWMACAHSQLIDFIKRAIIFPLRGLIKQDFCLRAFRATR